MRPDSRLIGNIADHHGDTDAITQIASVTSPSVPATATAIPPSHGRDPSRNAASG
jgi:hypothetical protein